MTPREAIGEYLLGPHGDMGAFAMETDDGLIRYDGLIDAGDFADYLERMTDR